MDYNLFSTPVVVNKDFISSDDREEMVEKLRVKPAHQYQALHGDAVSSFDFPVNIVGHLGLTNLINEKLKEYSEKVHIPELYILNSWFNVQHPGSSLRLHNHCGSIVSGALYLKVDDKSSPLVFKDPRDLGVFVYQSDPYAEYAPQPGDLVLFPSWLMHGSHEHINQSDERIVISFNTGLTNDRANFLRYLEKDYGILIDLNKSGVTSE